MDEASLVCVSLAVRRHGFVLWSAMVRARMLPELAFTSFLHGSGSGDHLPVHRDTIGVVVVKYWDLNECGVYHARSMTSCRLHRTGITETTL